MARSYLFAPSLRRGNGTGHLRRALSLMREMADKVEEADGAERVETTLFLPPEYRFEEYLLLLSAYNIDDSRTIDTLPEKMEYDFIIIDRRATTMEEYHPLARAGTLIGLDEGGALRRTFPLLIDTFPLPRSYGEANTRDAGLLDLPEKKKDYPRRFERILVSFGGEDPTHLTEMFLSFLGDYLQERKGTRKFTKESKTDIRLVRVVEGPLFGRKVELPPELTAAADAEVLRNPQSLLPLYEGADLVVTTFGLTAYEAVAAGVPVILLHPSEYHRTLSRLAGFPAVNKVAAVHASHIKKLLSRPRMISEASRAAAPHGRASLSELLLHLEPPERKLFREQRPESMQSRPPRAEGKGKRRPMPALHREKDRSFFRSPEWGLIYQLDFRTHRERYSREYFFEEYRAHYGKSYLEDMAHIRSLSRPRVERIRRLFTNNDSTGDSGAKPRLLDVGCAYGPFMQEAAKAGFEVEGTDISSDAVSYVRRELGFPAYVGSFPEGFLSQKTRVEKSFEVVTMWYVIEHFPHLEAAVKEVHRLLRSGGIFAFSTPNADGISGRRSIKSFLKNSPRDHHTVWTPRAAKKVLESFGFRVERIVSTGHHPERFPLVDSIREFTSRKGALFYFLSAISKIFALGDTFELYARKID